MRFLWGLQVKMYGWQELRPKLEPCDEGLVTLVWEQVVLGHVYGHYWGTRQKPSSPRKHPGATSPCCCLTPDICGSSLSSDFAKPKEKLSRMIET